MQKQNIYLYVLVAFMISFIAVYRFQVLNIIVNASFLVFFILLYLKNKKYRERNSLLQNLGSRKKLLYYTFINIFYFWILIRLYLALTGVDTRQLERPDMGVYIFMVFMYYSIVPYYILVNLWLFFSNKVLKNNFLLVLNILIAIISIYLEGVTIIFKPGITNTIDLLSLLIWTYLSGSFALKFWRNRNVKD